MVLGSIQQLIDKAIRFKYRVLTFRDYGRHLNNSATIQQRLLDVANGKRPPPPPEECREWAFYLAGTHDPR